MKVEAGVLLRQAYNLIDEMIRNTPPCSCHPDYISRSRIDPTCMHCYAMQDHVYVEMVAWRNTFTKLYEIAEKAQGALKNEG